MNSIINGPQAFNFSNLPSSWQARQKVAWEKYQKISMPHRKDEDWRFANIQSIQLNSYQYGTATSESEKEEILKQSQVPFPTAARLVFSNDERVACDLTNSDLKKKGVIITTLLEAVKNHSSLIENYFLKQRVALGSEKFTALHETFCRSGSVIYVPAGVEVQQPIVIFQWLSGKNQSVFPHTIVVTEANSKVTVLEICQSTEELPGFVCSYNDLVAKEGSHLTYVCAQRWSEKVLAFHMGATTVERDAYAKTLMVNFGTAFSRNENRSRLTAPGAQSEMLAMSLAHENQEFDQRTLQDHLAPNAWSDLLYKNSLNHGAKSIFQGLIRVEPGAKQTDAYQTNRNLLLSGEAEADSMPGLEILNDDVKCSHGATTGQVEEELLFYMQARGIPENQAKHLLVVGFLEEVVARLNEPEIASYLHTLIEEKFERSEKIVWQKKAVSNSPASKTEVDVKALQGAV
ncbi:MAG: Fe-S cluster assembly protein SufD [Verrucomicrobiae bacterium]|nr:Fe-S cluster assembly protein SufD [Verrucomicrobiae bacterium]